MKEKEKSLMFLPQNDIIARFRQNNGHTEFDGIKCT
jgi:hypothetical protein